MEDNLIQQERVFFQDSNVTITQSRYIANGTTYAMRNISSVDVFKVPLKYTAETILIILGVGLLPLFGLGLIFIIWAIIMSNKKKPNYAVRITTNAGETNSFISPEKEYIQKIVNAINEAIIQRG